MRCIPNSINQSIMGGAAIALAVSLPNPVLAENEWGDWLAMEPFTFKASVGVEYDDNVSVNELDVNTTEGDYALVLSGSIGYEKDLTSDTQFDMAYSFSQSLHDEFENFDVQTHRGTVKLAHDFEAVQAGLSYNYAYATLDDEGFLTFQQVSPFISKYFGKKVFVRGAYEFKHKDFNDRSERNADVHGGGVDLYYFIDGSKTYLSTGYKYEDQNANDEAYDFEGHQFKIRLSHRKKVFDYDVKLKTSWRFEKRNYTGITPEIGMRRDDERHRLQAEIEIPLTDHVFVLGEYEYSDTQSNLPDADYAQNKVGFKIGVQY